MRIGLIGWYGHENAGDDRMLCCLRRFFGMHDLLVTTSYADALLKMDNLNRCDYVLLGGGGLVLRGFGVYASIVEQLRPRFACVGISVEAVHRDNIALIEVIQKKAEFILVRDARSRSLLERHYKVIVGPDLTFLYPYAVVDPVDGETCGVNLRHWHYWRCDYRGRYYHFMRALDRRFPALRRLYPLPKWLPERALRILSDEFSTLIPVPLYTEKNHTNDSEVLRSFLGEVDCRFAPDHYRSCRYFVGMRVHSLMFAAQTGIPFVSLSYQPKNEEFCRAIALEHLSVDLCDLSKLRTAISTLKDSYVEIRQKLIDYRDKSRDEIRQIMTMVLGLIEETVA